MARARGRFEGPLLVGWAALAVGAAAGAGFALAGGGEQGVHAVIRTTARTSLALFLAAFTASSLRRVWRAPATAWLLRNRRYLGLGMALSHAVHLAAILALVRGWPGAGGEIPPATRIGGSAGYLVLAAMAATSSDRAVAWLGPRRWRALHRTGSWLLWGIFASSYVPRAGAEPDYAPLAAAVLAAAALRVALCASAMRGLRARSGAARRSGRARAEGSRGRAARAPTSGRCVDASRCR
jgi:DMSO/TMAO reductase YedYZ heme-binding membrane subunit